MKVRFIVPCPIEIKTSESYIGKDGKIITDKFVYTLQHGQIREVEYVANDGEGTYEIKFSGAMKGIATQLPRVWVELMTGVRAQPMPPEKCCPDPKPKQEEIKVNVPTPGPIEPAKPIAAQTVIPPKAEGTPTGPKPVENVQPQKL